MDPARPRPEGLRLMFFGEAAEESSLVAMGVEAGTEGELKGTVIAGGGGGPGICR